MNAAGAIRAAFRGRLGAFELDVSFSVPAIGITALFGPSGCGKTTVLRCIAGLERVADGYCSIKGHVWQDDKRFLPTHRRAVGYVFQEASLFPHLSVRKNLLYGAPRVAAGQSQKIDFDEVIALLGLSALLDRSPRNLSGGERQRVAIGRALLSQPDLVLMDEPLSALDRWAADEIMVFLERLHGALSLPFVYVSHDLAEVERLADHLILLNAGRVIAAGPLSELQSDPSLPIAAGRDSAVSLDAVCDGVDSQYGLTFWRVGDARFAVPGKTFPVGERRRLRVAANDVSLTLEPPRASTILNIIPARILTSRSVDEHQVLAVLALAPDDQGPRLLARVSRRSWEQLGLAAGVEVFAQIKGVALVAAGAS